MELKSMKNSKSSNADSGKAVGMDDEEYPYGLRISVEDEHIAAAGLVGCKVGDEVMIMAKAKVVGRSEYENEDSDGSKSVSLQITDMAVDKESDDVTRAEKLYE